MTKRAAKTRLVGYIMKCKTKATILLKFFAGETTVIFVDNNYFADLTLM